VPVERCRYLRLKYRAAPPDSPAVTSSSNVSGLIAYLRSNSGTGALATLCAN
jgi:hypothetical protein